MALAAARQTDPTSAPLTRTAGIPNEAARRDRAPAVTVRDRVVTASRLSLQTNTTGSAHTEARLRLSISIPWFAAPSPKNATATRPGRRWAAASPNPHPIGPVAPTIPDEAASRAGSNRCMWPPMPPHSPSGEPSSSSTSAVRSAPRATSGGVDRWSSASESPSTRWSTTPATAASSPIHKCSSPEIRPCCHSEPSCISSWRIRAICKNSRASSLSPILDTGPPSRDAAATRGAAHTRAPARLT